MVSYSKLRKELSRRKNPEKAKVLQGFFKTGPGEYGQGDVFLGLTVPQSRLLAKQYLNLDLKNLKQLLASPIHEERLIGLLILVERFQKGNGKTKKSVFDFYLKNRKHVNNWDLVDLTADKIVGAHLLRRDKKLLFSLARSKNVWDRRIAIIATFHFVKHREFNTTLQLSHILLDDKHDLIQKAVGWMLREVGKSSLETEEQFLKMHCKTMGRTALRYAIERFPEQKRAKYLLGKM